MRFKSELSLAIFMCLMVTFFLPLLAPTNNVSAATPQQICEQRYPGLKPPPGYPKCSTNGKPYSEWLDSKLNIVVYIDPIGKIAGNPPDMESIGGNRVSSGFKSGWQDLNQTRHKANDPSPNGVHPTFNNGGVKGEYRYYGYDKVGELYSNPYFINDSSKTTDPDTRYWLYRPWLASSKAQQSRNSVNQISPMLQDKYRDDTQNIYLKNAVDDVNQIIKSDFVTINHSANGEDSKHNLFDYMYVEQDPTAWAKGLGRMWHLKSDGAVWYQTFELPSLEKKPIDMVARPTFADPKQTDPKNTDLAKLPATFTLKLNLAGEVSDEPMYDGSGDRYDRAEFYNRQDVTESRLKLEVAYPGHAQSVVGTWSSKNAGDKVIFRKEKKIAEKNGVPVDITKGTMKKGDKITFTLTTDTFYQSNQNPKPKSHAVKQLVLTLGESPPPPPMDDDWEPVILPDPLECTANVPIHAFDIVPFAGTSDTTDMSRVAERRVYVDGVEVDDDQFFSGNYIFGDDADGLHRVEIRWLPNPANTDEKDPGCYTSTPVLVHDTVPRADFTLSGTFKENRKMTVDDDTTHANDAYVLQYYPITSWSWSWEATDGSSLADQRIKDDGQKHKEFLFKKAGEYALSLKVKNSLGRESEIFRQEFWVQNDFAPAVIMTPYSSQIARGEAVPMFYDGVSTDGDIIKTQHFDVYYDAASDETYSQKIDSYDGPLAEYKPTLGKLGKYKIVATVDEEFGEPTFPEFITAADKRSNTAHFEFEVDNYLPYSDLYTDIPSIRPQIDAFFLADKNLAQAKIDYMKANVGVTINNQLRAEGIDPETSLWDMHTYTYTQPAQTYGDYGSSYPPSTSYYCASGYCGTLNKYDQSDMGGYYDDGTDQPQTQTKTASDSRSQSGSAPCGTTVSSTIPGSVSYSDGEGYSGTLSQTNYSYSDTTGANCKTGHGTYSFSRSANYSGTVSRTIMVHVPNMQWHAAWRGYYSGTIYKDVRQPLLNPFTRTASDKYLIYLSDSVINEPVDFAKAKGFSDAKVILVGTTAIKSQATYDKFIENTGQPIESIVADIVAYIASKNPPTASQLVMTNETFHLLTGEDDSENDPIVKRETMYVQDENYFDNPMGHVTYALHPGDNPSWTTETLKTSFPYTGEYTIYRRIKDQPSADPKLASYSYYSNESKTIVRVHRKPIALATLDWTYDVGCGCYQTTWVDQSYDLDHNVSDPVKKGIVDRKIRYQVNGGEWYYEVPPTLAPGAYHLEYIVKDIEGAWSNPFVLNFTLAAAPPPQLKAKLKSEDPVFTISGSVPASESVRAYELWTRFPYNVDLQLLMSPAGSYVNRTVPYFTGTKTGSDITWNDVVTAIPATTPDGTYTYRVRANGSNGTAGMQDFTVKVSTPIQLAGQIDSGIETDVAKIVVNEQIRLRASTTEYPHQTTVTLFKGTSRQTTLTMTGSLTGTGGVGSKNWSSAAHTVPSMTDGTYTFEWTSRTPNGNMQTVTKQVEVVNNTPPTGDFKVFTYDAAQPAMPIYEGDLLHIRSHNVTDNEKDPLTVRYEAFDPGGTKRLDNSHTMLFPYASAGPDFTLPTGSAGTGTWTIKQTIDDGKAPPVIRTRMFVVRSLGIQGFVKHTDAWEANRLRYNADHPSSPRPANWFWAGEAFVLAATATDTGTSGTVPQSVKASVASPSIVSELKAAPAEQTVAWGSTVRSDNAGIELSELPDGPLSFVFQVRYSNGVVKSVTVPIRIAGTVDQYVNVHRVQ